MSFLGGLCIAGEPLCCHLSRLNAYTCSYCMLSCTVFSYECLVQVLLVASSFMSPADSKAWTNTNRVRMFGKPSNIPSMSLTSPGV